MRYKWTKEGHVYTIVAGKKPVRTPFGRPVTTCYKSLADRLVQDLAQYGEDPSTAESIYSFHAAFLDFYQGGDRKEQEYDIATGLDPERDWTCRCPSAHPEYMMAWVGTFGLASDEEIAARKKWLSSLTDMQLCAVCIIGRSLESVTIAYHVAHSEAKGLEGYAKAVRKFYPYVPQKELVREFENFHYYFTLESTFPDEEDACSTAHPDLLGSVSEGKRSSLHTQLNHLALLYQAFGPTDPSYGYGLVQVAHTLIEQAEYARAESMLQQALLIYRAALAKGDPQVDREDIAGVQEALEELHNKLKARN